MKNAFGTSVNVITLIEIQKKVRARHIPCLPIRASAPSLWWKLFEEILHLLFFVEGCAHLLLSDDRRCSKRAQDFTALLFPSPKWHREPMHSRSSSFSVP